jgi:hypothetical protein
MNPTVLKPFGPRFTTGPATSGQPANGRHFPSFYKLCSTVGAESSRDYVTDFTIFMVIGAITAWPILSCILAIGHILRIS